MDFSKMMKQAQNLQKEMAEAQKRMAEWEIEGISGGGMVSLILTGEGRLKAISLNNTLLEEKETDILEDLIVAAHNDALDKLEKRKSEEMGGMMADKLPFNLMG